MAAANICFGMSSKNYFASYKLRGILEVLYCCRSSSYFGNKPYGRYSDVPVTKLGHGYPMHKGLQLIGSTSGGAGIKPESNLAEDYKNNVRPPTPLSSPTSNFLNWIRWLLGSFLSLLLPLWRLKLAKMQRIEGEVENVAEEIENVAKVVEKVATATEKVSAELADKLPNNCKLKQTTLLVEQVSKMVAKDAKFTEDFIDKVDELKQNLEDLDTMVEPIINKIVERESGGK